MLVIGAIVLLAIAAGLPENAYINRDRLQFGLTVALAFLAVGMSIRDRLANDTLREWRNRAVLSVIAVALSLAAAEPLTRYVFRDITTTADNGGYFSRRWLRGGAVQRNHAGFRERLFENTKSPGTYRIAVIGDSFTFGNGIRQEDRYTDVLHRRLPAYFEVLNFGTPGANTPEHRDLVARLLPLVKPDFVLLQWYVNDMDNADPAERPAFKTLMPILPWHDWLVERSALYSLANTRWAEAQVRLGWTLSYSDYLRRRLGNPNGREAQFERQIMLDLIEQCRRANVPMGMVLFPDAGVDLGANYEFAYLHERVLEICASSSLRCVDLRQDFSMVRDRRELWANRLDHHPSALANEIAAEKILDTFSPIWAASPTR